MSRARPVPVLVALLITTPTFSAAAQTTAQTAAAPASVVIGQVVDGTSGQPIPGAIVTLDRSHVMTTSDGRFVFRNLDPGEYALSATKPGYLRGEFGASRPAASSRRLVIAAGQRRRDVVIRLWRHAAIVGTVIDEAGEPLIGVSVTALRRRTIGGRVKFLTEGFSMPTDDRGMYRIWRLPPGTYVVAIQAQHVSVPAALVQPAKEGFLQAIFGANLLEGMHLQQSLMQIGGFLAMATTFDARQVGDHVQVISTEKPTPPPVGNSPVFVYPTTYHPSAVSISAASLITVASGQERSGVNLQVSLMPTARVSGTLSVPTGSASYVPVTLIPADSERHDHDAISTMTDADGRFAFLAVPSGDYTLRVIDTPPPVTFFGHFTWVNNGGAAFNGIASPESPAKPDETPPPTRWASMPVSVRDADVTDLALALKQGFTISGQVEFEGTERPTEEEMRETRIYIRPLDSDMERFDLPPARLDKTDHFTTAAVAPGKYRLGVMNVPSRWSLKSAIADHRDVSGLPIEIESRNLSNVVFKLTDRPAALSGRVQASADALRGGIVVVIFPADSESWIADDIDSGRIRRATVAETGRYEFQALFPGDYYVAAIPESAGDDWRDPTLLQQLLRDAVHLQIADGERASRELHLLEPR